MLFVQGSSVVKILCVGGGPAGLYFAVRMKQLDGAHEVTVLERNRPNDTFGFGVVFSDSTLGYLHQYDAGIYELIRRHCQAWDAIEVRFKGKTLRCGGNGFAAISRQRLLNLLQQRALDIGVTIHFRHEFASLAECKDYDLVVASDGINSTLRRRFEKAFRPTIEAGTAKYIWFGTTQRFDSLTFLFEENEHGLFGVHAYPYDEQTSTFIVETDEESWRRAGLDRFVESTLAPGASDLESMAYCQQLFARHLHGHALLANNSKWLNFRTLRNETWHHKNIVLLGDAAHTAHFSVGSGTKMAMEDAIALSLALQEYEELPMALAAYERARRPEVERIQRASLPSRQWWEDFRRYKHFSPEQFTFHFLSRNPRMTYHHLLARDPAYVKQVHSWFLANTKPEAEQSIPAQEELPPAPIAQPLPLRSITLPHRLVAPLPIRYSIEGQPAGKRSARLTFLTDIFAQVQANRHIGLILVQFAADQYEHFWLWHQLLQVRPFFHDLLHTHVGLCIPAMHPELPLEQVDETRMQHILAGYSEMAQLAADDGFDILALDFTAGGLPFKFIAGNAHDDLYGGNSDDLQERMRFPLEVLDVARQNWPDEKPLAIRLSTPEQDKAEDEVIEIVRLLQEHGCDLISIEMGAEAQKDGPFARLRQRHLSERLRNEVPIATMMTGNADEDEINTLILAGRTDLYLFVEKGK
jgi:anthraniloyl-CoA monooxygenase